MKHLGFLYEKDEDTRIEYLMALTQILDVEEEADEWRFSQTFKPKTATRPVVKAKVGHINKFENEGIVERTYSSNSTTRYRLAVPRDEIVADINELGETIY